MYGHDGGDWLWMTLGMGFWLIVVGMVVYAAVRFASRDHRGGGSDR
jgi:heme/copper-type cytochrome/quinol oxidase subunit 2